jgi:hypothetical protein
MDEQVLITHRDGYEEIGGPWPGYGLDLQWRAYREGQRGGRWRGERVWAIGRRDILFSYLDPSYIGSHDEAHRVLADHRTRHPAGQY